MYGLFGIRINVDDLKEGGAARKATTRIHVLLTFRESVFVEKTSIQKSRKEIKLKQILRE